MNQGRFVAVLPEGLSAVGTWDLSDPNRRLGFRGSHRGVYGVIGDSTSIVSCHGLLQRFGARAVFDGPS